MRSELRTRLVPQPLAVGRLGRRKLSQAEARRTDAAVRLAPAWAALDCIGSILERGVVLVELRCALLGQT